MKRSVCLHLLSFGVSPAVTAVNMQFGRIFFFYFSDLIHTTESLRNAKLSAGKTEKESRNFDALLEPYRAENARVVRENNELHQELLRLKEEKERVTRGKQ